MNTFIAFIKIAFKNNFAYRSSILMGLFGSIVSVVVQIAIWQYVFRQNHEMITYMTGYVIISRLLSILYMNNLTDRIGEKIVSGDFVVDLIKPVYSFFIYWSTSLGRILASIVTRGLPLLIIFSPALFHIEFNMVKVIFFISVCTLDYILLSMLYILTGYLAFFVIEIWPFSRMLGDTIRFFSGAIIPIAFFPSWLADFTKLLPFHLFYSFPIRILLEDLPLNELLKNTFLIGMWGLFFFWVLVMIYKRAIWHSVVQGG